MLEPAKKPKPKRRPSGLFASWGCRDRESHLQLAIEGCENNPWHTVQEAYPPWVQSIRRHLASWIAVEPKVRNRVKQGPGVLDDRHMRGVPMGGRGRDASLRKGILASWVMV